MRATVLNGMLSAVPISRRVLFAFRMAFIFLIAAHSANQLGPKTKFFLRRVAGNVPTAADYSTSAPRSLTQQTASARPLMPNRRIERMTVTWFQVSPPRGVLMPRSGPVPHRFQDGA